MNEVTCHFIHRPRRRPMRRGFSDEIHFRAEVGGRPAEAGRQGDRLPGFLHHGESQENVSEPSGFLGGEVQGRRGGCPAPRKEQGVHRRAEAGRNPACPKRRSQHESPVADAGHPYRHAVRMDQALWR